jgi:hypothetical protein
VEEIFGRDLELTAMEQFLNSTPNWPSAMVIEGEAGIGKPRCGSRASGAQRNGVCGPSTHGPQRAAKTVLRCALGSGRGGVR